MKPHLLVPLTALGAGLVNLIGGGVALKAWIFNAGQTYYEALFRAFWLPSGALQLSDATITAAGYEVLRDSTEIWVLAMIAAPPLVVGVVFVTYPIVSLIEYVLKRWTPFSGISSTTTARIGRGYLLGICALAVAWIGMIIFIGLYSYPRAARLAGASKHDWLIQQQASNCLKCPEWGKGKIKGVAIASDGKQILLATMTGVVSLPQEGLIQTMPNKRIAASKPL